MYMCLMRKTYNRVFLPYWPKCVKSIVKYKLLLDVWYRASQVLLVSSDWNKAKDMNPNVVQYNWVQGGFCFIAMGSLANILLHLIPEWANHSN